MTISSFFKLLAMSFEALINGDKFGSLFSSIGVGTVTIYIFASEIFSKSDVNSSRSAS